MANADVIARVSARLRMVKVLIEHNEGLADPKKIQATPQGGWTHVYGENDALVNYLLLTCFDQLGQPDEWRSFSDWLKPKGAKSEREEVLTNLQASDPISTAILLHDAYNGRYGVKKSFNRFIAEKISPHAREDLMRSVKVEPLGGGALPDEMKVKRDFLYATRNALTHEAKAKSRSIGSASRASSTPPATASPRSSSAP
jgi:hypothetical protein